MWEEWQKEGIIFIGFDRINEDLSKYKKQDVYRNLLKKYYNEDKIINNSLALHQFVNVMKPGDIIIPKKIEI